MANALNPWEWQAQAALTDPGTFGWRGTGYDLGQGLDATQLSHQPHIREMLIRAGKWNPEWDAQINDPAYTGYEMGGGGDSSGTFYPPTSQIDWSPLAGYQLADARSIGHAKLRGVLGPDGQPLDGGFSGYDGAVMRQPSLNSSDYRSMASAFGPVLGAWGLGLGAGAGVAQAGAQTGVGTLGSIAPGSSALAPIGGSAAGGAAGLEASIAALNGMALPSVGAGVGAAGIGGAAGGIGAAAAGLDPMTAYMLTGAAEGSTLAGGLTGAGGAAGAVGAGSTAGTLSSIGNALSGFGGNGWANLAQGALGLYGQHKALGAMKDATNQSNEFNRYAFDAIRADNQPLVDMRNSVLPKIQGLLSNPSSITSDPGYQFTLSQGVKARENSAAARGMTYSGPQQKRLIEYGQDLGSTKLDQSLNRLTTVAGLGQVGSNSNNAATQNFANNGSNNALNMGNARGSAYAGGAGLVGNALQNYTNSQTQADVMRRLFGGP